MYALGLSGLCSREIERRQMVITPNLVEMVNARNYDQICLNCEGAARTPTPATKNYTPHLSQFEKVAGFSRVRSAMVPPRPGAGGFLIPPDSEPGKYELGSFVHSGHQLSFPPSPTAALSFDLRNITLRTFYTYNIYFSLVNIMYYFTSVR